MSVEIIGYLIKNTENSNIYISINHGNIKKGKVEFIPDPKETSKMIVKYVLPKDFIQQKSITSIMTIKAGDEIIKNLTIIEEHSVDGEIIQTFEFHVPFVFPGSVSEWETIYVPNEKLESKSLHEKVINHQSEWLVKTKIMQGNEVILSGNAILSFE